MSNNHDAIINVLEAIDQLRIALADMGPGISLVGIEIADGHGGRVFDARLQFALSYMYGELYAAADPMGRELRGVKVTAN